MRAEADGQRRAAHRAGGSPLSLPQLGGRFGCCGRMLRGIRRAVEDKVLDQGRVYLFLDAFGQ